NQLRVSDVIHSRSLFFQLRRLLDHLFMIPNQSAQHSRPAEKARRPSRAHNAPIDLHGIAPDQDERALRVSLGQTGQEAAIKRRLLAPQRSAFALAENL